jgi:hypothetical protein
MLRFYALRSIAHPESAEGSRSDADSQPTPESPCAAALKQGLIDLDNPKVTTVADHQAATGNAAQIEFWNSAATRAWADQYARMDRAVAALTKELLDLAAPQPGERVLDIGCGPRGSCRKPDDW